MTATINFLYPQTSAPTAAQMVNQSMFTAQIVMADGDTIATVVHNMAVNAANLLFGFPLSFMRYTSAATTTVASLLAIVNTDGNTVTITKSAQAGSAFTGVLTVLRPNTIIT